MGKTLRQVAGSEKNVASGETNKGKPRITALTYYLGLVLPTASSFLCILRILQNRKPSHPSSYTQTEHHKPHISHVLITKQKSPWVLSYHAFVPFTPPAIYHQSNESHSSNLYAEQSARC
jgi:hypothetical protein